LKLLIDLLTDIFGVTIGGLIAFFIARWQLKRQSSIEEKKKIENLKVIFDRIKKELEKNKGILVDLKGKFRKSNNARKDLWNWGLTYVNSLRFHSYYNLINTGLETLLPKDIEKDIYSAYQSLEDIMHWTKQAVVGHDFYQGFNASDNDSNNEFETIKMNINQTIVELEKILNRIKEYEIK